MMTHLQDVFNNMQFNEKSTEGMTYNSRVLVVDGLHTFIRSWAAIPTLNDNGDHIGGISGFLKSVALVTRQLKPTRVVIVFDGQGGSQRRRKIYPEYKSNRKPITRLNRPYDLTTPDQEQANLKRQLVTLVSALENLPVTVIALDKVEADDVIAATAEWVRVQGGKSIILSSDKDFLQLVSDTVEIWNPARKTHYTVDTVVEDYKIHPKNFLLYRALTGDKSDNIPGVNGVGEIKPGKKSKSNLLKYYPEFSESTKLDETFLYDKATTNTGPKFYTNILDSKDLIDRNLKLMDLYGVGMSGDAKLKIYNTLETHKLTLQKLELSKILNGCGAHTAIPNYDVWLTTSFTPLLRFYGK